MVMFLALEYIEYFWRAFSISWNVQVRRKRRVKTPFIIGLPWPILQQYMRSVKWLVRLSVSQKLLSEATLRQTNKQKENRKWRILVWRSVTVIFMVLCYYNCFSMFSCKQDISGVMKIMLTSWTML